ncbi:MAG: Phosphoribosylformylglycinamidine synthase subunit PurQ [Alphaproteobacteria bacterium MarineAlpha10_Bin1]|jgi:phosphoribosylformylglycinamidine synthase|nr:MAG: Phosphoribosylformylglycinamidine synthase subunit PurQ [Alphaproteobacteria bacterium MarineAlpha10_Bin1]
MTLKAAVIVFPGSNCDRDVKVALEASSGAEPAMVWHGDGTLPDCDLIVLPGGFSYGDYLRSGAMAATSPVMRAVVAAAKRGTRLLAICNGFQIAAEAGLLPGVLMPNASLKFVCKDVLLRVESSASPFTRNYAAGDVVRMPIAHRDGNYFASDSELDALENHDLVAFRYCDADGALSPAANPNGSARNIAGIFNQGRTVLGMMPHPERLADARLGGIHGKAMFDGLLAALA